MRVLSAIAALAPLCGAATGADSETFKDVEDDGSYTEELLDRLADVYHSPLRLDASSWEGVAQEVWRLAGEASREAPGIAFAVGTALYSYFWWENGRMNVEAGQTAADLVHRSILHFGCEDDALPLDVFLARRCHFRHRQLALLSGEVAKHLAVEGRDLRQAAKAMREASNRFQTMVRLPFFNQWGPLGFELRGPHDSNFNNDYYPHVNLGPVWPPAAHPLTSWLEDNFAEFRADLDRIMQADTFWRLHTQAFVSETQFTPQDDDWQTVYLVLNGTWVPGNCDAAPRACELLRSRPEISQCRLPGAGAGFLRLGPGGRLKPHYGNAPRLSVHLGLVVPPGDISMRVGPATVRWEEGRAVIFDDTFVHSVRHDGLEPRFVLNMWICHPCDSDHWDNPPESQPDFCRWPL